MALRKRLPRRYRPSAPAAAGVLHLPRPRIEIDRGRAWFAVWTPARGECRAALALERLGLPTYTPLLSERVVRRGKAVTLDRPGVGRYVFVGLSADADLHQVRQALREGAHPRPNSGFAYSRGNEWRWVVVRSPEAPEALGRVLRIGDMPLRVPAAALQRLEDGLALVEPSSPRLAAGDPCRAILGPFQGFVGVVQSSDDVRVRALLDLFGRQTTVEFQPAQLEAAA